LDDNSLVWSATLRVDIPRWPDWVQEVPLRVVPSGEAADVMEAAIGQLDSAPHLDAAPSHDRSPAGQPDQGITFQETASHLWAMRSDRDQVETLAEAVTGLTFDLEAVIERRLLYAGEDDPHVYEDGYAVWAHYTGPELPMVLYVPHELADDFEQLGRDVWKGRGTIVGWDGVHGRLQIKLERPA
jgi:hypothetical protein